MINKKRKIWFPVTSRVHLARQKLLLELLGQEADLNVSEIKMPYSTDEGGKESMGWRAGNVFVEAMKFLDTNDIEIVICRGDRFEMAIVALAATYHRKILAHIEGGEKSSSIDEIVRHSITKLSHLHFPISDQAKERIIRMGENPANVFNFGSLDCEFAIATPKKRLIEEPYILVLHHEILGEEGSYDAIKTELEKIPLKKIYVRNNNDFITEKGEHEFSPENFISLLAYTDCFVSNSSASIKESSILGIPSIVVGNRQAGRLRPSTVTDLTIDEIPELIDTIEAVREIKWKPDNIYFKPYTAEHIARILLNARPEAQKMFYD